MPAINPNSNTPAPTTAASTAGLGASAFTSNQIAFIQRLAQDSSLDSGVIAAWVYAEENGSSAIARQTAGNNNWLNIGYFDAGAGAIAFDSSFHDPITAADQTFKFLSGTWADASTGIRSILNSVGESPTAQIGAIRSSGWASSGYPDLPGIYASLSQAFKQQLGAGQTPGGTFGLGGTGTPANQPSASLWQVGDPANPDQDYWTTINQYSMDSQWYSFSDGETLFVADGIQLMAQRPQMVISRTDPAVIRAEATYDNTAFMYASNHHRRGRIQRRTSLARVISPTEVILRIICDIDLFRAGDTVLLSMFGPADGVWLIGDCVRNVFQPYSELTLVQAMQPLNAATGLTGGPTFQTGQAASKPGAGTVISAMISEASTISNDDYPYVWGGGHAQAGIPSGSPAGFDCSGAVGAVLAAGGLLPYRQPVGTNDSIIQTLLSQGKIQPGQGTGRPECTLFNLPGVHIFMRLNGQYWGTSDGENGNHTQPNGGAGWLYDSHADVSTAVPYHVPGSILGQQAAGG